MKGKLRAFGKEENAATMVEYAVLLTVIVGAMLGAMYLLGSATRGHLQFVAAGMDEPKTLNAQPVRFSPGSSTVASSSTKSSPSIRLFAAMALLGLAAVATTGLLVWKRLTARPEIAEPVIATAPPTKECIQARFIAKRQQILRALSGDLHKLLESKLDVRQLMTFDGATISPDTSADGLAKMMVKLDLHHLMVCGPDKKLLGVISDRDLKSRSGKLASDIMTPSPITIGPDALILPTVTLMLNRHISCLPVVEEGTLLGIVTTTDLVLALQCTMQVMQGVSAELVCKNCRQPLPCPTFDVDAELESVK